MKKNKKKKFIKKDPNLEALDIYTGKFLGLPSIKRKRKRVFKESDLYVSR